ncbi:DUF669 domain-containing protein [Lacticaseibacillus absianus]|uniref:DUF669 domain-containing protein n=1 Tax=Lacticaseibacillus absianus TaxID=2729623 RepID=UPI0015C9C1BC|nr:DUF669 domain-containing protein [Lacticaseibacillus absianus]
MSFITTDYSKNQENDFQPLPQGEYEMLITSAQERATKNGAESLQLRLTVRNDLDAAEPSTNGKYHNRIVFFDNWKRKKTNQYDMEGLQYVLEAAKIPEGTPLNSVDEFCAALIYKPVRVYVKVQNDPEYGDRNTVAPWNVKETKYPTVAHRYKDASQDPVFDNAQPTVTDTDLPF